MKNLNPYDIGAFDFYKEVCDKKRNTAVDPNFKVRLFALENNISSLFGNYDFEFAINRLQNLTSHGYIDLDKSDLHRLYKYDSAVLQKLKTAVTTTENKRKVQCQNCTMNEVNSLDHLVPKEEFPEFSVHPKNLLPCCSKCNSYKGAIWRDNTGRTCLNLYLDTLPDIQYLFVNVEIGNQYIETEFYLENRFGIDSHLFDLISSHYRDLRLLERFAEGADDVITSFKNIITPTRNLLTMEQTQKIVLETIEKDRVVFGHNYWQSVLKLELITNEDFFIE